MTILYNFTALAMVLVLFTGFVVMTRFGVPQALVMPLVASTFLALVGTAAPEVINKSFSEFGHVAIVFTAIAIPAHQLQRSQVFRLIGAQLGRLVGLLGIRFPRATTTALTCLTLTITYFSAAVLHNITAMLVMIPIIISICSSYKIPSRWLLCGALVASNLGGFSSSWGDTPNIIETRVWGLSNSAFFYEILPINIMMLVILIATVTILVHSKQTRMSLRQDVKDIAWSIAAFHAEMFEFEINRRLLVIGTVSLFGFIIAQFVNRDIEIAAAGATILFSVALERADDRANSLKSIDFDVYATLVSVFVIADCIGRSVLGAMLQGLIIHTKANTWALALSSYLGTSLTEAASWASAAAPVTYAVDPSNSAAWALGAGICAGSSSLLTAASAGVILWSETRRHEGHAITFRSYISFGLLFSLVMLVTYCIAISTLTTVGYLS
jgi:Na+/H+ antiporter NhaD and related arsenite permeases